MKRFNIAKPGTTILAEILNYRPPIGSVYGSFEKTVKTSYTVTDKRGRVHEKSQYQKTDNMIIYVITDFHDYGVDGNPCYKALIYNQRKNQFEERFLEKCQYIFLNRFLHEQFAKNGITESIVPQKQADTRHMIQSCGPQEKLVQVHSDSVFRARYGYAFHKADASADRDLSAPVPVPDRDNSRVNKIYTKRAYSAHGNVALKHTPYTHMEEIRTRIKPDSKEVMIEKMKIAANEIFALGGTLK